MTIKELEPQDGTSFLEPAEPIIQKVQWIRYGNIDPKTAAWIVLPALAGLVMVWFGLTTTGSYFMPASRFSGFLADVWYVWQLGTLMAIVGSILIYDAIKRSGYL